jgi:hypothetical protein
MHGSAPNSGPVSAPLVSTNSYLLWRARWGEANLAYLNLAEHAGQSTTQVVQVLARTSPSKLISSRGRPLTPEVDILKRPVNWHG